MDCPVVSSLCLLRTTAMSADRADEPRIMLAHGGGGVMMQELIGGLILRHLGNPTLNRLEDAAVLAPCDARAWPSPPTHSSSSRCSSAEATSAGWPSAARSTTSPPSARRPLALSLSLIIEEGLAISVLDRVLQSVAATAAEAGVEVVTGDTKVVERGAADGLFLITAGIGAVYDGVDLSPAEVRPGDAVIATGTLGDHGIAIISQRSGIEFESPVQSDVAPLAGLSRASAVAWQDAEMPATGHCPLTHCRSLHARPDARRDGGGAQRNRRRREGGDRGRGETSAHPARSRRRVRHARVRSALRAERRPPDHLLRRGSRRRARSPDSAAIRSAPTPCGSGR